MSDSSETEPDSNPRTWTSREAEPEAGPELSALVDGLAALSRLQRPEEVMPLLRRSPSLAAAYDGIVSISTRELEPGRFRITRMILDGLEDLDRPVDTWSRRHEIPVHEGGFISDLIREARPQLHHELQVVDDPVLGDRLADFGTAMAIPLMDEGEALNWVVFLDRRTEATDLEELKRRTLSANLLGGTVRLLRARQEIRAASEAMTSEIERIAEIQSSFMPRSLPAIPGWSLAGRFETCGVAGGDLWTARTLEDGSLALLVADASGHGPAAAVTAAMTHAVFHSIECDGFDPDAVAGRLNRYLARWQVAGAFVTAVVGRLDPATGSLVYARCGHPPPLLRPRGVDHEEGIRRLDAVGGPPLGIVEELDFETATVSIQPGDTLAIFTDGVLEARSPAGDMLGEAGVLESMLACDGDAACTLRRVETAIHDFEGARESDDDQTVVVLHRVPST